MKRRGRFKFGRACRKKRANRPKSRKLKSCRFRGGIATARPVVALPLWRSLPCGAGSSTSITLPAPEIHASIRGGYLLATPMFSRREILVIVVGMVLATALTIFRDVLRPQALPCAPRPERSPAETGRPQASTRDQSVISRFQNTGTSTACPSANGVSVFVAVLRQPITEFRKQRGVGVEDVRHGL